jgi:hypothetical protein
MHVHGVRRGAREGNGLVTCLGSTPRWDIVDQELEVGFASVVAGERCECEPDGHELVDDAVQCMHHRLRGEIVAEGITADDLLPHYDVLASLPHGARVELVARCACCDRIFGFPLDAGDLERFGSVQDNLPEPHVRGVDPPVCSVCREFPCQCDSHACAVCGGDCYPFHVHRIPTEAP